MAEPKGGRLDRDLAAYIENTNDGGTDRRVNDQIAHDKLDTIAGGLGVTDTTTTIFNVAIPLANTEVSQALPANTKKFMFKSRSKSTIKFAYTSGASGTTYITLPAGAVYEDDNYYTSLTIYFQSSKMGDTLELIAHS
jgi:hypothetical protein